ncbi:hypothetical protein BDQ17DRAFT_1355992 [Cyathus striatus]|nr:hypothetical protein BDQ17DRAFT_1355992 [Cyathus striatus]
MQIQAQRDATHGALRILRDKPYMYQRRVQEIKQEASVLLQARLKVKEYIIDKEREIAYTRSLSPPESVYAFRICWMEGESSNLKRRVKEIEENITLLHLQVMEIEESFKENERAIIRTQNYFSPIYSLPVELLRYIFALCQAPPFPSQPIWYPFNNGLCGHIPPPQVLISQVSTRFRDIVQGSPDLWTNINVDASNHVSLDKLRTYLDRSATQTIHITFYSVGEISEEELHLAWIPVVPHICRIGTLNLIFKEDTALGLLLRHLTRRRAPRLTAFKAQSSTSLVLDSLNINPLSWSGIAKEPFTCFLEGGGSMLRSLDFECVLPGITPWNFGIRRMHVKMPLLRISRSWLPVLASFSGLVALSLGDWHLVPFSTHFKSFTLPHLRFFKIGGPPDMAIQYLKDFFDVVQMPKLESLSVIWHSGIEVANLFYTLSTSYCQEFSSLRMLSFLYPNPTPPTRSPEPQLILTPNPCFSNPFEQVEQVAFVGLSSTNEMVKHLFSCKLYCSTRLPKLKLLSIGADDLRLETVERLITCRGLAECPIPRIEVNHSFINPLWGPEIVRFFRTNVKMYSFDSKTFMERMDSVCFPPLHQLS